MMIKRLLLVFLFSLTLMATTVQATMVDTFHFRDSATQKRAFALAKVLRCPQCKNQNLLESNSPIASDLRLEVYKMANAGETDQQIIQKMTARFGNFVLYDPPLIPSTYLLWGLPILLFIFLSGYLFYLLRKRNSTSVTPDYTPDCMTTISPSENWQFSLKYLSGTGLVILFTSGILYLFTPQFSQFFMGKNVEQKTQMALNVSTTQKKETYIHLIQEELRKNPNDASKWLELAQAYMQTEDFNSALTCYANAEKLAGSTPKILGLAATAYFYQNHQQITPKVQQLLNVALKKDPSEISSLSLKAHVAFQQHHYAEAIQLWQKILDSDNADMDRRTLVERIQVAEFLMHRK